jgi:hypothetical protein
MAVPVLSTSSIQNFLDFRMDSLKVTVIVLFVFTFVVLSTGLVLLMVGEVPTLKLYTLTC